MSKCALCDGNLVNQTGAVEFHSKSLGMMYVPNINHKKCESCGDVLISSDESQKIIDYVKEREEKAIGRLPVSEFISLNEAAKILGITKQAFSKNAKIKNKFIYSAKIGGRTYYNRTSVQQFKKFGDGRYRIPTGVSMWDIYRNIPESSADKWTVYFGRYMRKQFDFSRKSPDLKSKKLKEKIRNYPDYAAIKWSQQRGMYG